MTHKEYKTGTKTFTEEDFKNPPPVEERTMEYKKAYADWAKDNELTIKFKTMEEGMEWLRKRIEVEERDPEYKKAYADWAKDNGLTIKFKTMEEGMEWLRKRIEE